jgi:hypothetical protein
MSNVEAIGAVTATLRNLILDAFKGDDDLGDTEVTVQPPDKARGQLNKPQLNLFLFQVTMNGAWRNQPIPQQVGSGEAGWPPLPLDLHYLLSAWGRDDNDVEAQRVLGRSMSTLHDHTVLGSDEIKNALPGNDLYRQVERVRLTPQPLTIDEISKLWSSLATNYRVSTAYEASVVLIESRRPAQTPLPVLTRGPRDTGFPAQANLDPPFPYVTEIEPSNDHPASRLGEQITIKGFKLDGANVSVEFANPLVPDLPPLTLPRNDDPARITLTLPDDNAARAGWVAGVYRVSANLTRAGDDQSRTTNGAPFALAPAITAPDPLEAVVDPAGKASLQLTIKPNVLPDQRVGLLLGDRELLPEAHDAPTNTLTFSISGVAPQQTYLARLRIDGVDSIFFVTDPQSGLLTYDQSQIVTFTQ